MMSNVLMVSIVVALFVVAAQIPLGLTSPSTVPAFLWSPNLDGSIHTFNNFGAPLSCWAVIITLYKLSPAVLDHIHIRGASDTAFWKEMKEMVDYRILSPRDLAKSVMTEGRWSNYLCSREAQQSQDFAFVFVGTELQSLDISRPRKADPTLVGLLEDSFSNSNFSFAFPYVSASEELPSIENSLISEFSHTCQPRSGISSIALIGSCSVEGENFNRLEDVESVQDYMHSRMEKNPEEHTDLIVVCNDQQNSESKIISQILNSAKQLGAKYTFLYVSDPFKSTQYPSHQGLERFLAEGDVGNGSSKSTACDGLCQIKSSLLEGIFVGIVLLIILISGLCCMAGIDTPTRFETPQDS